MRHIINSWWVLAGYEDGGILLHKFVQFWSKTLLYRKKIIENMNAQDRIIKKCKLYQNRFFENVIQWYVLWNLSDVQAHLVNANDLWEMLRINRWTRCGLLILKGWKCIYIEIASLLVQNIEVITGAHHSSLQPDVTLSTGTKVLYTKNTHP